MLLRGSSSAKLLLGVTLLFAACTDQAGTPATGPTEVLQAGKIPAAVTCAEASPAEVLVDCLFPAPGLRNAAQVRLANILRQYERGEVEAATGMMFDLVDFTLSKKEDGLLLDPQPLGQAHAISLLFERLFETVGMEAPIVPDGALDDDGAVSVVSSLGGTVATGTQLFGVSFAENAFHQDVLVTIERLPDVGPLPTTYDQYGPFYRMSVSPGVDSIAGITTGLCFYTEGSLAPPDDPEVRARLHIARTVPGTTDEIKILGPADAPSFIDCADVTQVASLRRRDARILASLGKHVSAFLTRVLEPAPLSARTQGGQTDTVLVRGGTGSQLEAYSVQYGTVDDEGAGPLPDLIVWSVEVSPTDPVAGEDVTIEVTVVNVGDVLAPPSLLVVEKAPDIYESVTIPFLDVDDEYTATVVVSLDAGTYDDVLATADEPNDVAEYYEDNNDATFSFTVAPAPASLSGHVYMDGDPIYGATVTLVGSSGTHLASTAASGAYYFGGLDPGTYGVSANIMGYYTMGPETVILAAGESATLDFNGASLYTTPEGTGPAATWTISAPSAAVDVCNGEGATPCSASGSTVTLQASATGPTGSFPNPWVSGWVYFYYHHGVTGAWVYIGRVAGGSATMTDDGYSTRTCTWTLVFDATGVPAGALDLLAVGSNTSGTPYMYATPVNTNVTVVNGS